MLRWPDAGEVARSCGAWLDTGTVVHARGPTDSQLWLGALVVPLGGRVISADDEYLTGAYLSREWVPVCVLEICGGAVILC